MNEPTLPDRVCKRGHWVSLAGRTGRIHYSRGKPILACIECRRQYESDMRAWGLRK